ncbi:hypothetical protein PHLH8_08420 [Pseudomonas sp. Pc102]|nr:hypothetical protein PHLH8_08420 [Pseudomonas sp. Pc102]
MPVHEHDRCVGWMTLFSSTNGVLTDPAAKHFASP